MEKIKVSQFIDGVKVEDDEVVNYVISSKVIDEIIASINERIVKNRGK